MRDLAFLVDKINETEVYERAEKVNLAGGDGQQIIDQFLMKKSMEDFIDDEEVLSITDLEKGFKNE